MSQDFESPTPRDVELSPYERLLEAHATKKTAEEAISKIRKPEIIDPSGLRVGINEMGVPFVQGQGFHTHLFSKADFLRFAREVLAFYGEE